jgi:hypothetical protein
LNWSSFFQDFLKRPTVLCALAGTGVIVLFIPSVTKFFYLDRLPYAWWGIIGVATLFSAIALLSLVLFSLYDAGQKSLKRKQSLKNINLLSDSETLVIAKCLEQNSTTADILQYAVGLALVDKGLLKIVRDEKNEANIAYILEPHVWEAIQPRRTSIIERAGRIRDEKRREAQENNAQAQREPIKAEMI